MQKKKLIRKQYARIKKQKIQTENYHLQTNQMINILKGTDLHAKQQLMVLLNNLMVIPTSVLTEKVLQCLLEMLYNQSLTLIHTTLFAINNICELNPSTISVLFQLGFDQALIQLKNTDQQLLEPILVLLMTIYTNIPKKYLYLIQGVHSTLTISHLQSKSYLLVLQFMMRTEYQILSEQIIRLLFESIHTSKQYQIRSISLNILLQFKNNKFIQEINVLMMEYFEQICNIDLEKEYIQNIMVNKTMNNNKNNNIDQKEMQTDLIEQQINNMNNVKQQNKNNEIYYDIFTDKMIGLEILFENMAKILDEDEQMNEQQQYEQQQQQKQEQQMQIIHNYYKNNMKQYIENNISILKNNLKLSFIDGQSIIQLCLRIIHILKINNLSEQINYTLTMLIKQNIPIPILICNIHLCLQYFINMKLLNKLDHQIIIYIGQNILSIDQEYKQCWFILLEIYGKIFNPQNNPNITQNQHSRIAIILSKLLKDIPYLYLQEWRAQVLDTLFDVYSNQNYNVSFIKLQFLPMLQHIKNNNNTNHKKSKFIKQVLNDVHRFILYKKSTL